MSRAGPVSGGRTALALALAVAAVGPLRAEASRPPRGPRELPLPAGRDAPPTPAGGPTAAQTPSQGPTPTLASVEVRRSDEALRKGLAWLAAQQELTGDGSLPAAGARLNVPVPVAALAALAFMAGGSGPDRGPFGRNVGQSVDYLLSRADLVPGSPTFGYIASEGDTNSRMHGHAFATLALAQAWSISPRTPRGRRIEEVLTAASALIERSQGLEGGWFYEPRSSFEHENSVTVVLAQALRAARGAGVTVDPAVISRAVEYIRRCQLEDGSFRYALSSGETSVALTAAGLTTLNSAGVYEGGEIDRAVEALWRRLGYREDTGDVGTSRFPCYERFYLAQALWQHSDPRLFDRWVVAERERVLGTQREDGSWQLPPHPQDALHESNFGACYATAMNCLFLAIPDGLLPIFQR